jgi:hypothetical protein
MGGRKEREKEGRVRSVRPFRSGELTVVEVALNVVDDEPGSKEQEDEKRGEKKMKMSFPNDSHDKSLKGGRKKKGEARRGVHTRADHGWRSNAEQRPPVRSRAGGSRS